MTDHWEPRTEADIQAAINQGLIRESHVFDAKRQPPPPAKNIDIAVDLASFAVDGGSLLYGVSQPKSTGPTTLAPFDLGDLPERLDQIARGGAIDPPLSVRVIDIPSDKSPGTATCGCTSRPAPTLPTQSTVGSVADRTAPTWS